MQSVAIVVAFTNRTNIRKRFFCSFFLNSLMRNSSFHPHNITPFSPKLSKTLSSIGLNSATNSRPNNLLTLPSLSSGNSFFIVLTPPTQISLTVWLTNSIKIHRRLRACPRANHRKSIPTTISNRPFQKTTRSTPTTNFHKSKKTSIERVTFQTKRRKPSKGYSSVSPTTFRKWATRRVSTSSSATCWWWVFLSSTPFGCSSISRSTAGTCNWVCSKTSFPCHKCTTAFSGMY